MKKAAAKKKTTTLEDDIERYAAAASAKQQFLSSAFDMGWRMALMVIISVLIGVKIDERYNTAPSYTIVALMIAVFGSCWIVAETIKSVNQQQTVTKKRKTNK